MKNLANKIKCLFCQRAALCSSLSSLLYWLFTLVYLELVLHAVAFGMPGGSFGYVIGFSLVFACLLSFLTLFLPAKVRFAADLVLTVFWIVLFGSQIVYFFVFGTLYSVALIGQGGAAVTSFFKETVMTIWEHLPVILLLLLPIPVRCLLWRWRKGKESHTNGIWQVLLIILGVLAQLVSIVCLPIGGTGYFSNHYFYYSNQTTTDQAVDRFGLLTAFRLDLMQTGEAENTAAQPDYYIPTTAPTQPTEPQQTVPGEETQPTEPPVEYNVLQFDFDALMEQTEDARIQAIHSYCQSLKGTEKNAYTGMLRDYNLIFLCAESFSTGAIHPELTPTLYRLANEGIIFTNYYNSYPSNTTDGEYALCTGLYPDSNRGKEKSSFYASRNSYLPFCLGNAFTQQLGVKAYGYHNFSGDYYGRNESHTNMGYTMKFANDGMEFTTDWPSSDLEMMQQSVADYLSTGEQFHAYYMTFSGHFKYDPDLNPMADRNWDLVKNLDLSKEAKAYLSCNIELDKALEYLMQELEKAGVADKTAIVLAGDHYPYGLTNQQYSELVGYDVDSFTKYESTLIFWVGGLEEPIVVEEYCSSVDVLPTILNLWDFQYDSRMLAGKDILAPGEHYAVLRDMSFYTDKLWLNASTGEIRYLVDESQIPEGYVEDMIRKIQTQFSLSADILNTAYYNTVFQKGDVVIDRDSWDIEQFNPS